MSIIFFFIMECEGVSPECLAGDYFHKWRRKVEQMFALEERYVKYYGSAKIARGWMSVSRLNRRMAAFEYWTLDRRRSAYFSLMNVESIYEQMLEKTRDYWENNYCAWSDMLLYAKILCGMGGERGMYYFHFLKESVLCTKVCEESRDRSSFLCEFEFRDVHLADMGRILWLCDRMQKADSALEFCLCIWDEHHLDRILLSRIARTDRGFMRLACLLPPHRYDIDARNVKILKDMMEYCYERNRVHGMTAYAMVLHMEGGGVKSKFKRMKWYHYTQPLHSPSVMAGYHFPTLLTYEEVE